MTALPNPVDVSMLPPCDAQFVALADTHYMDPDAGHASEFPSRAKQTERAGRAFQLAAAAGAPFAVHLGDHVQSYPSHDGFEQTLARALGQIDEHLPLVYHVAGNTDIGDKPDPTTPAEQADEATLETYHRLVGPSWRSVDEGPLHVVILNASILNSGLEAEHEQRRWLENDLATVSDRRIVVAQHYAPFLYDPDEPWLGNYDVLGEPARGWLLDLFRAHGVDLVLTGHSHFAFLNEVGGTRIQVLQSTSFTRPGFSEMFADAPPAEHGRDDVAKLGFYLVRLVDDRFRVHLVRTQDPEPPTPDASVCVTRTSTDLPNSQLGLVLRQPLSGETTVPAAFPSVVPQPVRNDYPLLAIEELGARYARLPALGILGQRQSKRVEMLRADGVKVIAEVAYDPGSREGGHPDVASLAHLVDGIALVVPEDDLARAADLIQSMRQHGLEVSLAPFCLDPVVAGKELPRGQVGLLPTDVQRVADQLWTWGLTVDRICVRATTAEAVAALADSALAARLDVVATLGQLPHRLLAEMSQMLLRVATAPGMRLFVDPLVALDRTMDVIPGLLDRSCNPAEGFHGLRLLTTLLFSGSRPAAAIEENDFPAARVLTTQIDGEPAALIVPLDGPVSWQQVQGALPWANPDVAAYDLTTGYRVPVAGDVTGPRWVAARRG